jgi:hypothetical protein
MKTRTLLILFCCLLLSSCTNNNAPIIEQEQIVSFGEERILYDYKGVSITRVDEGTESHFYYGNYKDSIHLPASYIRSTFHGFNSGMDAWLLFKPDHVEIYHSMGNFETMGDPENIDIINSPGSFTINHFEDKVRGKYDNVCRISDILVHERELNASNHFKVKVSYPTD